MDPGRSRVVFGAGFAFEQGKNRGKPTTMNESREEKLVDRSGGSWCRDRSERKEGRWARECEYDGKGELGGGQGR